MPALKSNCKQGKTSDGMMVITTSDQELLKQALAGNEDAFTALYRRRQGAVYRFALQMTGNVVIAEDVTQDVFMELLEHGQRFDPARGAMASFLYGIARNLVFRRLEKDRTSFTNGPAVGAELSDDFACDDDVLGDLTRQETIDQVRRAVLSLPGVYREVVVLCDLQDLSYDDAAQALDCPVGTVRSRLNRGRGMLAQKLGQNPKQWSVAARAGESVA
jgi:RNA polymerase sigma-70 factor, ECF subfamily